MLSLSWKKLYFLRLYETALNSQHVMYFDEDYFVIALLHLSDTITYILPNWINWVHFIRNSDLYLCM